LVIEVSLGLLRGKTGLWVFGEKWNGSQQFSSFMENAVEPPPADFEVTDTAPPMRVYLLP